MEKWRSIAEIRREYGSLSLSEEALSENPLEQFEQWFQEVLQTEKSDPTAMVLATVDEHGHPDARVVLLKGLEAGDFVFYTNYDSAKAHQLAQTPYASLNFYWPQMARQVRISGGVERTSQSVSDAYFASRPRASQLSAIASLQSQVVASRAVLEARLNELIANYQEKPVVRPESWGGYRVTPEKMEFWQGRDNRLHDRILYELRDGQWAHSRLSP